MAIGTASVILVVTISLTSRDYILNRSRASGPNIIFAYYASAGGSTVPPRRITLRCRTLQAIRQELTSDIVAATGVMSNFDRILFGGKEQGR
jgi:putative ABC transport system permease protein